MPIAFLTARILFGGFFVVSGMNHFLVFSAIRSGAAEAGLPLPGVATVVTGLMMLVGGLCIIVGLFPRIGAALLILFLGSAALLIHTFWAIDDPQMRTMQQVFFLRNIALIGAALAFTAVPRPWTYSLESFRLTAGRHAQA